MTKKAFLTIAMGATKVGTLELELFDEEVPKTVLNFEHHLEKNFKGCKFHRIIKGFMAQGGDFTNGDGTGGTSIYGNSFADESFHHKHTSRGMLSMANSGPDTNGSQFFITFKPTAHLDGKHVVFGMVVGGEQILQTMENVATGRNNVPKVPLIILDCGVRGQEAGLSKDTAATDDNEIDLDDEGEEEQESKPEEYPEEEQVEVKAGSIKDRLRRLKMKMNQARQLNRQEVQREGERLGSEEGKAKERQRLAKDDKKRRETDWQARNTKAVAVAAQAGYDDGKFLVEPADKSLARAQKREATEERNLYQVKDYHNPEGQFRHYERNVKSLPKNIDRGETDTYNPMSTATTSTDQADGAKRLANELKRRIEKQKKRRDRVEFEGEDVSYINKRNKHFNKKINRNYDQATAEIRQNLERGTAL
jgi:cyclophilin family peptidyl-prolyl cis-trans isomerase